MAGPFLSLKIDFVFKKVFGSAANVEVLKDFLMSVLDLPAEEYQGLTLVDTHLKRDYIDDKMGILDLIIHTPSGQIINVEIQLALHPFMRERLIFYTSGLIKEQIGAGDPYEAIKRVICILITDWVMVKDSHAYHNRYRLYDKKTGSELTDLVEVNVLELPKVPKESDRSPLWSWLRFISAEEEEEAAMLKDDNPHIEKAFGILKLLSGDEEVRFMAEARQKAIMDYNARYDGGWRDGKAQGREEGLAEGLAQGEVKGRMEGRTEGLLSVAENALRKDMPLPDIAELTGLSLVEIEALAARLRRGDS